MSGQHTPGPWEVKPEEAGKPYIRIRGTRLGHTYKIANVLVHTYPGALDAELNEARKTARLIAAAPDFYEACKALIAYCDKNPPMGESLWSVQLIRAAIAKAEGGAT